MQRHRLLRILAPLALFLSVAVVVARLDLRPHLGHLEVSILSGTKEGGYHATVERLRAAAARKHGRIANVATEGSVENLARLVAASKSCEIELGLAQAGLPRPEGSSLELLGRLPRSESMFLLGKRGDEIGDFASLAKLRIGIGPAGSGTALLARQLFESRDFAGLGLVLSNHPIAEQLELAQKGELDLAAFVMDEDAAFIDDAVRARGLQIAGMPHADVVARRFDFLRHGRIGAGQYDPVNMKPPTDKMVLRVETLVVGNGCASRSETMGVLTALSDVFPDFARHNRETPDSSGLELSSAARSFFENGGPELLDRYLPRIADVMPPSNWVHVVMGVSLLFNAMGIGNRFRLWRIDAARVKAEQELAQCFGPGTTLGDIARFAPSGDMLKEPIKVELDRVIRELEELASRSRSQSLSVLVPMGGEMAYRYQEALVHETLAVLRAFRERWIEAHGRAA